MKYNLDDPPTWKRRFMCPSTNSTQDTCEFPTHANEERGDQRVVQVMCMKN